MSVPPFPRKVQIQTTVACGADCSICPHPEQSPHWTNGRMDDGLFDSILEQLAPHPIEYVSPYLMADPLSDRKIFERVARLRDALPNATLEISTTGKYLVPKLASQLLEAPLTELRISSHGISAGEYAQTMPGVPFEKAWKNIHEFIEMWRATQPYKLAIVCLWGLWSPQREAEIAAYWRDLGVELAQWRVVSRSNQVDLTTFGQSTADPTLYVRAKGEPPYVCRQRRDSDWLHVLSDGRVTLCCMDYGQQVILGDLRTQTLEEVWHGSAFEAMREQLQGSCPPELCRQCEWHVSAETESAQHERNAVAVAQLPIL